MEITPTRLKMFSIAMLGLMLLAMIAVVPTYTASGAGSCPSVTRVTGSTTVGPIAAGEEAPFEAQFTGTDVQVTQNGSGAGITAINNGTTEVGMSSKPLSPSQSANLYTYIIARDELVMGVHASANMNFISDISVAQVKGIYEGTITNWSALGGPNQPIVPRARIIGSGSRDDLLRLAGVSDSLEQSTISATGLPRLNESLDMANAAANNDYQIVYTSLANLNLAGFKALSVGGVSASPSTISFYPMPRSLHMMTKNLAGRARIDDTPAVLGDDIINFTFTPTGQNLIQNEGFIPEVPAASQPIPDADVNMDGTVSLGDLGAITAKWGQVTNPTCKGWIRADANNSGGVSLGDIGVVTGNWGHQGFIPPTYNGD